MAEVMGMKGTNRSRLRGGLYILYINECGSRFGPGMTAGRPGRVLRGGLSR